MLRFAQAPHRHNFFYDVTLRELFLAPGVARQRSGLTFNGRNVLH